MGWSFDDNRPIYLQLVRKIELDIIAGKYKPSDKLPSVRDLAQQASVNPNTMQRALLLLEQRGLISTQRNTGRTITENTQMISELKQKAARSYVVDYFDKMKNLGFTEAEAVEFIEHKKEEQNENNSGMC